MWRSVLISTASAALGAVIAAALTIAWLQPSATEVVDKPTESTPTFRHSENIERQISTPDTPQPKLEPAPAESRIPTSQSPSKKKIPPSTATQVYERANRGVVNISTHSVEVDDFFALTVPSEGSGSGILIDGQGHILTNFHVIENAREADVTLYDGSTYAAELVGVDPNNDLAVIKIAAPSEKLHPIELGEARGLRVGQPVFAIGNPFGLERTLTSGLISSLNRSLRSRNQRTIKSIIQTDAAINPGNSGGPLLDEQGRLIGVNTAIASRTGQSSGVGFALPVSTVKRIIPQLVEHGHVTRADAGILRLMQTPDGLLIARLLTDGPAEQAGLRGPELIRNRRGPFIVQSLDVSAADTIVAIDGKKVASVDEFLELVESHQPGDTIRFTILREGVQQEVPVTLGADDD